MNEYQEFLKNKIKIAPKQGFECSLDEINPRMKPHNRLMVKWMVEGGRRACFASFGLHKTVTQLEAVRVVLQKLGGGKGLIVCPLSVRQEFVEDAKNILGWEVAPKFIRRIEETDDKDGIYRPPPDVGQFVLQVGEQGVDVGGFVGVGLEAVGVEVAIGAFLNAPGNVDIEREWGQGAEAGAGGLQ